MNKQKYFLMLKEIKENYRYWKPGESPYFIFDWDKIWTLIERNVWGDIRYLGLPFYPQFPAGKYFIDFADPLKKIGIEVDGKEWHQNKEKDLKRQQELEKMGWMIIRIKGKDTFKEYSDYFPEDFEEWLREKEDCERDREEIRNQRWDKYIRECSEGILYNLRDKYYWQH